ncbi:MAG TPA: MAPEG family protein [Novosphingobium sp.]|nr:MAPEG family protein [Novosphingobium sp.]
MTGELVGMEILKPVVALAAWTMLMWLWMYVTRIPAMNAAKIDTRNLVGGTGKSLDGVLPDKIQWIAHNYNHLHEAPTVFYAVALVLAMIGAGDGMNANIAWAYVGLRVLHSLVQAIGNRVMIRFLLFALSSLALIALTLHAAMAVFH